MIFFIEIIKTIIYQTFPITIYGIIENINVKQKLKIFNIVLIFSNLLLICFTKNNYFFILANINLLILYLKNNNKTYLLINLLNVIYFFRLEIPLLLNLFNTFMIFITLVLSKEKEKAFLLINTYLYTFIIFYINEIELISKNTIKVLIILILNIILTKTIKYLMIDCTKSVK